MFWEFCFHIGWGRLQGNVPPMLTKIKKKKPDNLSSFWGHQVPEAARQQVNWIQKCGKLLWEGVRYSNWVTFGKTWRGVVVEGNWQPKEWVTKQLILWQILKCPMCVKITTETLGTPHTWTLVHGPQAALMRRTGGRANGAPLVGQVDSGPGSGDLWRMSTDLKTLCF